MWHLEIQESSSISQKFTQILANNLTCKIKIVHMLIVVLVTEAGGRIKAPIIKN